MSRVIDTAREVLIRQRITSFKPDVTKFDFGGKLVVFDTFQNYAKLAKSQPVTTRQIPDGCTIIKGRLHLILIHELPTLHRNAGSSQIRESARLRSRWTLAHEIGHVSLGHREDSAVQEREANLFAGELLIPELVVLELQRRLGSELTAGEVARLFGVSRSAAENRLGQIGRKSRFSAYLKSELMEKYKELVENYVTKCSSNRGATECRQVHAVQ
jgi:hypothetical protein